MKWPKVQLEDICIKISDGEHGSVKRTAKGHIFLNAKNINKEGNIDWGNVTFISPADHERIYKRCNPETDDILVTTTGTIGNIAIVPKVEPFSMDRGITLLKLKKELINSTYLFYLLRSEYMHACMLNKVHASAIGHLFMSQVKTLPVLVPTKGLQNQFADFVQQLDKSKYRGLRSLVSMEELYHLL